MCFSSVYPLGCRDFLRRRAVLLFMVVLMLGLQACTTRSPVVPKMPAPAPHVEPVEGVSKDVVLRSNSRWVPVSWVELQGLEQDTLDEAWSAWLRSCDVAPAEWRQPCADVRRLSIAAQEDRLMWMRTHLQPYRVESLQGGTQGLLTSYYEPFFEASRQATSGFEVPLYRLPKKPNAQPWYTRQQIDTLPEAREALRGREIAWLNNPVDAMILHIQGSGRLRLKEPDGSVRWVRMSFAGTNEQPYKSIGRWLLDQGLSTDVSWPGIQRWIQNNPTRQNELLWSNPRYVFFKEEALDPQDLEAGPRGAQGVALTPGRSIAVDRNSIPYGTPVWLVSESEQTQLQRLVLAQDTGSAIVGAVRADYFAGSGAQAGEFAGRIKQPLRLWVLWPR